MSISFKIGRLSVFTTRWYDDEGQPLDRMRLGMLVENGQFVIHLLRVTIVAYVAPSRREPIPF